MFLFIDMPSWSNFFSGGILDMLKNLFQYIITFFSTCADSLHRFYDTIGEINGYVRCGCLFTIFKLVYILYRLFEKLQDKIANKNSKTLSGLLSIVENFFS